ncbi:MAG: hypothetical protein IKQ16_10160 [Lentisphaeria bacterium]|nr:hypothetical protein [Lentisphaeria bacterium]
MLNRIHFLRTAAIVSLISFVPVPGFAADEKEADSLWGYADPTADVCVYINTKQAENAMEKGIWERIQKDKNEAIAKKSKGQLFSTKDRDMELMCNVRITSVDPFCGSVNGVANISGNLQGDIDNLMEMMKGNDSVSSQMTKQNDLDFYSLALGGLEGISGVDCMFVPVKPDQVQFRININSPDAVQKQVLSRSSEPSPAIKKLSGRDLSFACIIDPEKIAGFSFPERAGRFAEFLKQTDEIALSVYVAGTEMILSGAFSFKTESSAADFQTVIKPFLSEAKEISGAETPPGVAATGKDVEVKIPISISDAWDLISHITETAENVEFDETVNEDGTPSASPETGSDQ